jgi:hypothetical protein
MRVVARRALKTAPPIKPNLMVCAVRVGACDTSGDVHVSDELIWVRVRWTGCAPAGIGPNAVACDADGYVYVTEDENHRIRIISPTGNAAQCKCS